MTHNDVQVCLIRGYGHHREEEEATPEENKEFPRDWIFFAKKKIAIAKLPNYPFAA